MPILTHYTAWDSQENNKSLGILHEIAVQNTLLSILFKTIIHDE